MLRLQIFKSLVLTSIVMCLLCMANTQILSQVKVLKTANDNCLTEIKEGRIRIVLDPYEGPYKIIWPDNSVSSSNNSKKSNALSYSDLGQGRHFFSVENSVGCSNLMSVEMLDERCQETKAFKNIIEENQRITIDKIDLNDDDLTTDELPVTFTMDRIHAFPNPFSDEITIEVPEINNGLALLVTNSQGTVIANHLLNQSSYKLNTSDYPAGIYNITIISQNNNPQTERIVKIN